MKLWNAILAWFKSKNITSHTVAAALVAAVGFYAENQEIRDYVNGLLVTHPKVISLLGLLVSLWLKYSHSSSPATRAQKEQPQP